MWESSRRVMEGKENPLLVPPSRRAQQASLSQRRQTAVQGIARGTKSLHDALVGQRRQFEEIQPDVLAEDAAAPAGVEALAAAEEELRLAEEDVAGQVLGLAQRFRRVRAARKALYPQSLDVPAVLAFAVSAPSTSWATEMWIHAPLHIFNDSLRTLFLAAYSNEQLDANKRRRRTGQKCKRNRGNPRSSQVNDRPLHADADTDSDMG